MTHLHIENKGKTTLIKVAQIRDVLHIMEEVYQQRRTELLQDLELSGADTDVKMQALRDLRDERGSVSLLMKSAFTLEGSLCILKHLCKPEDHESLQDVPMDQLVIVALKSIGFEPSENDTDDGEEGKG